MVNSKTFWAVTAVLSFALAVFSGFRLYSRCSYLTRQGNIIISKVPPLEETEKNGPAADPAVSAGKAETVSVPVSSAAADVQNTGRDAQDGEPAAEQETKKNKALRTDFEYRDAGAGKVTLAGSFSSWKDIDMTNKKGVWKVSVWILPGTYLYHFTADGVNKSDPSAAAAPTGDSVVTVTGK